MPNTFFHFKEFRIDQEHSGMKVTTDGCLFGAWTASVFRNESITNVLDIGAGTGLLTLMLAQKLPAEFHAVEFDEMAFEEAEANFRQSPWSDRIQVFHQPVQEFEGKSLYDLIICNPPFFKQNQSGLSVQKNRAVHDDNLSMVDLLSSIERLLSPGGKLAIMYPAREMKRFAELAIPSGLYMEHELQVFNGANSDIFRVIAIFSRDSSEVAHSQIVIRNLEGYTDKFSHLIADYYL